MTIDPSPITLSNSPPNPRLDELIAVLARLRAPGGCAWDREQTHESLVQYLIEETYELVDAIENGSREELIEELGDVLYQVIFHADIAVHSERERFNLEDVAAQLTAKMVGRHPHVFGDPAAKLALNIATADDVTAVWDDFKAVEKPHRTSVLDGIPQSMPALALADKLIGRAQRIGVSAVTSRTAEAAAAAIDCLTRLPHGEGQPLDEHQLGGLLLAIVASAKASGLDAERALRTALRTLQSTMRSAESEPVTSPEGRPRGTGSSAPPHETAE